MMTSSPVCVWIEALCWQKFGELLRYNLAVVQPEKFPLIEQSYYSDFREMIIGFVRR